MPGGAAHVEFANLGGLNDAADYFVVEPAARHIVISGVACRAYCCNVAPLPLVRIRSKRPEALIA
jgi:hypothetical protein